MGMAFDEASCIDCGTQGCAKGTGEYPDFCPTKRSGEAADAAIDGGVRAYEDDPFALRVMRVASDVSTRGFDERWCRVEETVAFFREMGWRRIGIASCAGLADEARTFAKILRAKGFEPFGVCCKVGAIPKARFDAPESCCDFGTVSCNPLSQAALLAEAGTEANVVIGLCVGHDMLFNAHSAAPVTTLVAKDRAMYHNPVGALNAAKGSSYYNRLLKLDGECCA